MPTATSSRFDSLAGAYQERSRSGLWAKIRAREVGAVRNWLCLEKAKGMLDIGCGAGFYFSALPELKSLPAEGCDGSPAMAAAARASGWKVTACDFRVFQPVISADRVLSAGMLEFTDPQEFFRLARSWLPQGGRLVILVPRANWAGWAYWFFQKCRGTPAALRTCEEYKVLAAAAGFQWLGGEKASVFSQVLCWTVAEIR